MPIGSELAMKEGAWANIPPVDRLHPFQNPDGFSRTFLWPLADMPLAFGHVRILIRSTG